MSKARNGRFDKASAWKGTRWWRLLPVPVLVFALAAFASGALAANHASNTADVTARVPANSGGAAARGPQAQVLGRYGLAPREYRGTVVAAAPLAGAWAELIDPTGVYCNGCTVDVEANPQTFILELWINGGPADLTAQQSYLTFTNSIINVVTVANLSGCQLSTAITRDPIGFDTELQNQTCNYGPECAGQITPQGGLISYAAGAFANPPQAAPFRVAEIGLCAVDNGTAQLNWQFSDGTPPQGCPGGTAPANRNSRITSQDAGVVSDCTKYTNYSITFENVPPGGPPVTFTRTATRTHTNTRTPTRTRTATPGGASATNTPTATNTAAQATNTNTPANTATDTPVNTATNTPVNTATNTPVNTATNTPVEATNTNTPVNTSTNTPVEATNTNTPVDATNTNTPVNTATNTPVEATNTNTPVDATNTSTPVEATNTNTPVDATNTNTPVNTATNTPVEATSTDTPVDATTTNTPVNTATNTPVEATNTNTPVEATNTNTPVDATNTNTPVNTATNTPEEATNTNTPVNTATNTPENTATDTPVNTATNTPVSTATNTTVPATNTRTPTRTHTHTPEPGTATDTPEVQPTRTRTFTKTPTFTKTRTHTRTPTDTRTATGTRTATRTRTATKTPTPCGSCDLRVEYTAIQCNPDGTVHFAGVVFNDSDCSAPTTATWMAELIVKPAHGSAIVVRTQTGTGSFSPGDTIIEGDFCYQFAPDDKSMKVKFTINPDNTRCDQSKTSHELEPCVRSEPCPTGE